MTDWPVKTLGEVCEFQNGYAFRSSEYVKKGHALIRIKNVQEGEIVPSDDVFVQIPKDGSLDQFVLDAGDILMSLTGYLGRVGRIDETELPAALNQRVAKVSVKTKASLFDGFLYRVLDSQWFRDQVEVYGRGAAQQNVGTSDISKIEIPVPPLEEQKRIVALLDAATARVTELTACYEQARTHANNLFTSALRNALESDPDWPIKTLGDLLEVSIGGIWGSEAGEDEVDVFVYRSTELIKDGQLKEELTVRRSITARQLDSRKLEEGDLLLEKSGGGPKTPVGRVGLVKILPGLSVCSNFMQLMRPRKKDVLPVYLHYFLNHFHVAGHTEDLQNNSTNIRNLKTTEYMDVEIPLPPLVEQKNIVSRMDSMRAKTSEMVAAYDAKLTSAKNLRQSILEAAFAGEL